MSNWLQKRRVETFSNNAVAFCYEEDMGIMDIADAFGTAQRLARFSICALPVFLQSVEDCLSSPWA